ncbi:hypothetical protein AnigIFM49718_002299 [Aspergillus niger]|nr:hypothetical protein AlacWU_00346 [Aspergillus niger]GKZ57005.1 hypothetical protein AnigIFM49718_002299 [Aspergillus niger]
MGVPFEALLPFGIIIGSFTVGGAGLWAIRRWDNEGKMPRWNKDKWDRYVITSIDVVQHPIGDLLFPILKEKQRANSRHPPPTSDGERPENHGHETRTIEQPGSSQGIRAQQPLEGTDQHNQQQ